MRAVLRSMLWKFIRYSLLSRLVQLCFSLMSKSRSESRITESEMREVVLTSVVVTVDVKHTVTTDPTLTFSARPHPPSSGGSTSGQLANETVERGTFMML